jgi:hypothetical protein
MDRPAYVGAMNYEPQRESRKRKLQEGWKRVEAFLDPETAKRWARLVKQHDGPTALVKAALDALEAKAKRGR